MVATATENQTLPEGMYDPDDEAPSDFGKLDAAILSTSVLVDNGTVYPSQGDQDERIVEQCAKYGEKANYAGPVWFLEATGVSVVRTDGTPFRVSDIIKLKSTGKDGNITRTSPTPNAVAKLFTEQGVTASYAKVGTEDSAVGRMFAFEAGEVKLGGGYSKKVKLFPVTLYDKDFVYDGEVREVEPRGAADEGAPTDGGSSTAISEPEAIEVLRTVLAGHTPAEMLDIVLDTPELSGVATIFGMPLVEAATDESLATLLQENKVMAVGGDGKLAAV